MTPDVTVLIPTAGRPDMLRKALSSVAAQTARERIRQVVISENLGDMRSRAVGEEFAHLPVQFILRLPQLSTLGHAHALFGTDYGSTYAAVLHDDDWWQPGHLERSLEALDRHPAAAASYGGYWCVIGEKSSFVGYQDNHLWWIAAGRPEADAVTWTLNHRQVMLATLGGALGHYSSLVARAPALRSCAEIYEFTNPMDNDRLLTVELSRHGPMLYHPLPDLLVRQHATQDFRRFVTSEQLSYLSGTTRRVIELARTDGFDLRAGLEKLHADHPEHLRPYLAGSYAADWCRGPLEQAGLLPAFLRSQRLAGNRLRAWIPPALVAIVKKLRRKQ